ncbi:SigE family RNA polymerase sigma factor [Actinocrispum wychmicini]|uniref:RNA polymerase sigma-70 factor (Sigma-E family) n=1 Tax=Actinocrispum wychmicini TaxID=1213861 RepID=A0A4R2IZT5_9PSEU|nr:SigE family RNA polymerase sigma factor [Actinocrispum wychmicini]TCO50927.1 RNA polymerase sigma-70 factor (sigma-E family) [Actinocrispum wychmicini]
MDFEEFSRAHSRGLVRFAAALTGDTELAQDLVQDALVRAYLRWSRVSQLDKPDLYLRKMVTNGYLSWRRRWYQRSVQTVPQLPSRTVADHAGRVDDTAEVSALLATLTRRQQVAIVLRFFEDRTDDEIADVLGCAAVTVRTHISRALAALRAVVRTEPLETR